MRRRLDNWWLGHKIVDRDLIAQSSEKFNARRWFAPTLCIHHYGPKYDMTSVTATLTDARI